METLSRLVSESLARHGFDRPLDYRRLQWSRWFRCESHHSLLFATPSDVALQDARKAIEMFKQLKVDILGLVENMSHFTCPHCHHEIDIFSKEGGGRTAKQYDLPLLAQIELDPELRRAGDAGQPAALAGEDAPHARVLYEMARNIVAKAKEVGSSESVIQVR